MTISVEDVKRIVAAETQALRDDIHEIRIFVDAINTAFVAGKDGKVDYSGHRKDHELRIAAAEAEKLFWDTARSEFIRNGVGALMWVLKTLLILAVVGAAYKLGLMRP